MSYREDYRDYPEGNNTDDVMSIGEWIFTIIILGIPIVNIIMYLVWAFSSGTNKNKQNYCKASLIISGVAILFALLLGGCSGY